MNIPTRESIIKFLDYIIRQKSERSIKSYIAIKNALNNFQLVSDSIILSKGHRLYRSRIYKPNDFEFYNYLTQLCHILDSSKIKDFGRANEPHQSIFYCSDERCTSIAEVSENIRNSLDSGEEIIVTGIWEVQEDFRISRIISNDTIKGLNTTMDGLQTKFEEIINKMYKDETSDLLLETLDLFSKEFTRNTYGNTDEYLISCAYANYLYENNKGQGIDFDMNKPIENLGILYPSVWLKERGMNLALDPKVVYSEKIKLKEVLRSTFKKTNEDNCCEILQIKSKKIDYDNGEIIW